MSLQTWKKEFYSPISKTNKKNSLQHSLTKWIGLRKENLAKHEVEYNPNFLGITYKGSVLSIDASSCSLCKNYGTCDKCPLNDCQNEYRAFVKTSNPEPMIALIQMTIDKDLEKKYGEDKANK